MNVRPTTGPLGLQVGRKHGGVHDAAVCSKRVQPLQRLNLGRKHGGVYYAITRCAINNDVSNNLQAGR